MVMTPAKTSLAHATKALEQLLGALQLQNDEQQEGYN
jgi:hypothetical protein